MPRIMIAAPASGSGKTLITCGLLQALKEQNRNVISYKCGPDYIDPMFHRTVIGVPSLNLDTFFQSQEEILSTLWERESEYAVIEGVMGLYDGLGGTEEDGSAYHLAKLTKTPIILVLNAKGMGRTMVSLLKGICMYDSEHLIKGVILNQTSQYYCDIISPIVEQEVGIKVLGCISKIKDVSLESRHLGLKLPHEIEELRSQVERVAKNLMDGINLELLNEIASSAEHIDAPRINFEEEKELLEEGKDLTLAVARDEAFCFYYEQNIEMFRKRGVTIKEFSPLHDDHLPECDGFLLGGGYPELCARELSGNQGMIADIRTAIEHGVPSLAECGGFMYLHQVVEDVEGMYYPMVGVVPGKTFNTGKLCRFGYVELSSVTFSGRTVKAHEFHYYDSESNGTIAVATKPTTGKSWECMHLGKGVVWGFPHLYYPSAPWLVDSVVKQMRAYHDTKG